jgi:RNA polymerase sigma-70 factor (ECF subfamily)
MEGLSDGVLVSRCLSGEIEAFGELVQRYQQSVFNVCFRMLRERREAEDLTQDTFLRAYRKLETFDIERSFGPWIRRVAANLCLNHLEKRIIPQMPLDDERDQPYMHGSESPEATQIKAEERTRVREEILKLPPKYRVVLELRHYQNLTYAEIAETLKIPMSDVKSHLFRGRKQLAERLKDDDGQESHQ